MRFTSEARELENVIKYSGALSVNIKESLNGLR